MGTNTNTNTNTNNTKEGDPDPEVTSTSASSTTSATSTTSALKQWETTKSELRALANAQGWVSLKQFAEIAGISYPAAVRWCKYRMLNYVQFGGQKRIFVEEIRRFLVFGTLPPNRELFKAEREERAKYDAEHKQIRERQARERKRNATNIDR